MLDVAGKRVTVMGLGRFGGGLGVTGWLAARGARVLVTDTAKPEDLAEPLAALAPLTQRGSVSLRLGGHDERDFTQTDLVVANPAVATPWDNPFLHAARQAGVGVTTEIALTVRRVLALGLAERTVGVTGTVGKSTTTAMIAHALGQVAGPVLLGGNLGGSLLEALDQLETRGSLARPGPRPWVVLELSSAMLHWLGPELRWSPAVAVVTNFAANHVDWHGSIDHYRVSKQQLLAFQRAGDDAVLGPGVEDWGHATPARVHRTGGSAAELPLRIPGRHNRVNAAQALAACRACLARAGLAVDEAALADAVADFAGLPHRLQHAGSWVERAGAGGAGGAGGVAWEAFNDSKSTTPESTLRALDALSERSGSARGVHLIAGGYDKKIDLTPLAAAAVTLGGLYTIGQTGAWLASAARRFVAEARERAGGVGVAPMVGQPVMVEAGTLERAVEAALAPAPMSASAATGAMTPALEGRQVLLLSPGCASWDQFPNFEHRGEAFLRLVRARVGGGPGASMPAGGGGGAGGAEGPIR